MRKRRLGRAGPEVSEIAFGCSGVWGQSFFPEEKARALIHAAVARGITFFDTGHNYCNYQAEPRLGRALREVFATRPRADLVISTKLGTTLARTDLRGRSRGAATNFSPDYVERTLETCLGNLGCDWLDIFFLHGPARAELTDALLGRLADLKRAGVIRAIGVNTHDSGVMEFIAGLGGARGPGPIEVVLIDYNLAQTDREPAIARLAAGGIGVLAGTALAQGHLLGRSLPRPWRAGDWWYLARALLKPASRELAATARATVRALRRAGIAVSLEQAIGYVLANPAIGACVFGTTEIAHLDAVVAAAERPMPPADLERIRAALRGNGLSPATRLLD